MEKEYNEKLKSSWPFVNYVQLVGVDEPQIKELLSKAVVGLGLRDFIVKPSILSRMPDKDIHFEQQELECQDVIGVILFNLSTFSTRTI